METLGEGVAPEVNEAVRAAARHYEALGATVEEVSAGQEACLKHEEVVSGSRVEGGEGRRDGRVVDVAWR